jgi:hypothetical protein
MEHWRQFVPQLLGARAKLSAPLLLIRFLRWRDNAPERSSTLKVEWRRRVS